MKKLLLVMALLWVPVYTPRAADSRLAAFPGAEGYGRFSVGGRGGKILHVTNLNDSGAGSLRAALEASGPRIVVIDVSGTIELNAPIRILNPYLTVAGQTSPGGIQLRLASGATMAQISVGTHDVIIRHMRVRPGYTTGINSNGINLWSSDMNHLCQNTIVDHCSVMWTTDDLINVEYANDVTVQWCLIAETINLGGYEGKGLLAEGYTISIHHNLFVHCKDRNPFFGLIDRPGSEFVNNIIYNWGGNGSAAFGERGGNRSFLGNIINNIWIAGADSNAVFWLHNGSSLGGRAHGGTKIYGSGNWTPSYPSGNANDWTAMGWYTYDYLPDILRATIKEFGATRYSTLLTEEPTSAISAKLMASVGAYKPARDSADTQAVNHWLNRTGDLAHIGKGGPWPILAGGLPPADTDGDGIPDFWESSHGLDPKSAADGNQSSSNGYTHIENYLNELAGDTVPAWGSKIPPPANLKIIK